MVATKPYTRVASASADEKEPLQVRIPVPVKRAFKAHAAMLGLEPNKLFVEMWDYYQAHHNGAEQDQGKLSL